MTFLYNMPSFRRFVRRFYHNTTLAGVVIFTIFSLVCALLTVATLPHCWFSGQPYLTLPEVAPVSTVDLEEELLTVKLATNEEVSDYIYKSKTLSFKPQQLIENTVNPCWLDPQHQPAFSNDIWKNVSSLYAGRRCLPYFYIAGFAKSATTDLWSHLMRHPQVVDINPLENTRRFGKEVHWWTRWRFRPFREERKWYKDNQTMDFYTSLFDRVQIHKRVSIAGDGSPDTLWESLYLSQDEEVDELAPDTLTALRQNRITTPQIIYQYAPDSKFIVMMRNPTDRLYSNYLFETPSENASKINFHNFVSKMVVNLTDCFQANGFRACLHNRKLRVAQNEAKIRVFLGMYVVMINDLLNAVPIENIKFINFDDYVTNTEAVVLDVLKFLKIDSEPSVLLDMDFSSAKNVREEADSRLGDMWPATRKLLDNFYSPFNQVLANRLGNISDDTVSL